MQFDCTGVGSDGRSLEARETLALAVDIAYEGPQPPGEGLFYPLLQLQWHLPDDDAKFTFQHRLTALNLYPQSLFIVPVLPGSVRTGKTHPISWLVWNLTGSESEIQLMLETGEGIIYHGRVQDRCKIPALSCERVGAAFIPLQVGEIRPPVVSLRAVRPGDTLLYETLAVPPIISLPS